MLTIAVDARKIYDGGIGTYLRNILLCWKVQNINVRLFLFCGSKDISYFEQFSGFAEIVPHDYPKYSFSESFSFRKPLLNIEADLFFTPHYTMPFNLPCPAVATIHDLIHLRMPARFGVFGKAYAKFMINHTCKNSSHVLTDSKYSKDDLVSLFPKWREKVSVINPGVDTTIFKRYPEGEISRFKIENSLPDDFILYVGAMKPHKNPRALVKIVDKLQMNLVIVSQDMKNYSKLVLPQIKNKNLVRTINAKSDYELAMIYNCARAMVFPSYFEGFGLPPLEAMACGCPCVVSNRTSLPEVCGDAALYCDPDNADDIAEKIDCLLSDSTLRQDAITKGYDRARRFTWDKTASTIFDILKEAAGE